MKAAHFKTIYTMNLEPFSVNKFCKQVSIVINMVLGMANTHERLLPQRQHYIQTTSQGTPANV